MSSTNRGYVRHISDVYITPAEPIEKFLKLFLLYENLDKNIEILDPCCGEGRENSVPHWGAPYPAVLHRFAFHNIITMDIRPETGAKYIGNYLLNPFPDRFGLIISNPPFDPAIEFIRKAIGEVKKGGFVVFLLRLNFFGSQERKDFFDEFMPKYCFVHSKRISFFPKDFHVLDEQGNPALHEKGKKIGQPIIYKKGATDSIEYAHFVWQEGYKEKYTKLFVI